MNIFYLDDAPDKAAIYHCDKHVVKMLVESCQLLANCYTLEKLRSAPMTQNCTYRKYSYFNHPCSKWVRESQENFSWLFTLASSLNSEYCYRYNRIHSLERFLDWIGTVELLYKKFTPPPQCMPDYLQSECTVTAYRNYYVAKSKVMTMRWTHTPKPDWM